MTSGVCSAVLSGCFARLCRLGVIRFSIGCIVSGCAVGVKSLLIDGIQRFGV